MVQAYEGDGICAYFGVPAAHEDDPERAARAGLRILEVVADVRARRRRRPGASRTSQSESAINTGQAAVGPSARPSPETVRSGTRRTSRPESSRSPSRARSSSARRPRAGSRTASSSSRWATSRSKVASQPVRASRLVGPRGPRPVAGAAPARGPRARDGPTRWTRSASSRQAGARCSCSSGEPGIGKTRLLAELRALCRRAGDVARGPLPLVRRPALLAVHRGAARRGSEPRSASPEIVVRTKARARLSTAPRRRRCATSCPRSADCCGSGRAPSRRRGSASGPAAYARWIEALAATAAGRPRDRGPALGARRRRASWPRTCSSSPSARRSLLVDEAPRPGSEGLAIPHSACSASSRTARPRSRSAPCRTTPPTRCSRAPRRTRSTPSRAHGLVARAGGQPALPRGAVASASRRRPASAGERGRSSFRRRPAPARAREPPRRPDRPAFRGGPGSSARRGGDRSRVPRGGARARRRTRTQRGSRRAPSRRDRARGSALPGLRVRVQARAAPGGRALDADARPKARALRPCRRGVRARYADSLDDHLERLAHYHAQAGNLPKALDTPSEVARSRLWRTEAGSPLYGSGAWTVTQTAPSPTATRRGTFPMSIVATTSFVSGSIRDTVPARLLVTQTASSVWRPRRPAVVHGIPPWSQGPTCRPATPSHPRSSQPRASPSSRRAHGASHRR